MLVAAALSTAIATPLRAQESTAPATEPTAVASDFLGSLRALRWDGAARRLHPETLDRFQVLVSMIAEADTTGAARRHLTGTDERDFATLAHEQVFARAIASMLFDMPGLAHALSDRDDHMLGTVLEGADAAHVVYRTLARIGGAVPEVKVLQLGLSAGEWRVRWSDELAVLDVALRGVSTGRRGPDVE